MNKRNGLTRFLALIACPIVVLLICGYANAVDDGARAYWKGRAGTNAVSVQFLNLNMQGSEALQFDPAHYIYPSADVDADIVIVSLVRHMTLFDRPASVLVTLVEGSVDADFDVSLTPPEFLPPGVVPGAAFSQSASGFADPAVQLDVNLLGTPPLKGGFDLLNYEPTWTLDAAVMLGITVGE